MPRKPDPTFDPDFAGPAQWAAEYRAYGLQVIPCYDPHEVKPGTAWKRPALSEWVPLQETLVSDATFLRWYDPATGEHRSRRNMGLLTGRCSDNAYIIDLDVHKNPAAMEWWLAVLEVHNNGLPLESPAQRTGGGGLQLLFRAPPGFIVPTNRTNIGVDIRGQGGFAVLPPSLHESGKFYEWLEGRSLRDCPILMSPDWLLEEIVRLVLAHGGTPSGGGGGKTSGEASSADYDAFGHVIDGRETYMRDMIWAALIGYRADNPIPPGLKEFEATLADYHRNASARSAQPNEQNEAALEREGRGATLFKQKWAYALGEWHNEIAAAAKLRPPDPSAWVRPEPAKEPPPDPDTGKPLPLLLSSRQFVAGFTPPSYLIDGLIQRGYIYSLTARTNHGKTAVGMYMAQAIARGEPVHGREVEPGTVLMLAGENPDDIRARYLVLAETYGFRAEHIKMRFLAGACSLIETMPQIKAEADQIEDLVLVLVDTAAAYFPGDDTNDNSQQSAYARVLRSLTTLRGKPAVLVNCHPVKNAVRDNLLPMGGSAFVNEVDGNLTLWANNERQTSLHWQGKFRGPEFEPLSFELMVASSDRVKDAKGRLMPSVVAKPISEISLEASETVQENDEDRLLHLIHKNPKASFSELAAKAGFVTDGKPQKARVQRIVARLKDDKLVEKHRGNKYRLTRKGYTETGLDNDDD